MDTQTVLPIGSDNTANATAAASEAAQEAPLSDEDLLPLYLLAMAGAY